MQKFSVLFVCTGNICRSPTAEVVVRHHLQRAGLVDRVHLDSAGTHGYHVGHPPDERAQAHAARRGYDLSALRARKVDAADFQRFDLILAMDRGHLHWLRESCPTAEHGKLKLMMDFAPPPRREEVPDPYYGGPAGFELVLDCLEAAAHGLVEHLRARLTPNPGNFRTQT
ncbi:MAG: phosphotyrosine protein phosphatase [Caldimonas sp.]|uniref:low molecular weight protein-tyrosine-phosphatase n=1 Tax=Caldimonas manganoxidans TaxID=196015 RepID=UPI00036DDF69|nr:low molecular weight protein-tyrosine-phosphatase [Caldimonas manganoxidans]GIX23673.1 MAG: phosphotyrosine protein phosphatase [Caldimonas sp.]